MHKFYKHDHSEAKPTFVEVWAAGHHWCAAPGKRPGPFGTSLVLAHKCASTLGPPDQALAKRELGLANALHSSKKEGGAAIHSALAKRGVSTG